MIFQLFSILAAFIVAPFNGLLAEQTAIELGVQDNDPGLPLKTIMIQGFSREWQKLRYYIPRVLGLFVLGFIPIVNLLTPVLWLLFAAWMMAVQYLDYAADNQQVSFNAMLSYLKQKKWQTLTFGLLISWLMLVPILNFFLIPICVIAATIFWWALCRSSVNNLVVRWINKTHQFADKRSRDSINSVFVFVVQTSQWLIGCRIFYQSVAVKCPANQFGNPLNSALSLTR